MNLTRPRIRAAVHGLVCAAASITLAACAAEPGGGEKVTSTLAELEVAAHARGSACSTTVVRGLTEQLVAEINCMHPDTLRSIASIPAVDLSSAAAAAPYLTADAAAALRRAAGRGRGTIRVNSALRTLPQQYLLYRWKQRGLCGIRAAATPGTSNHESALAVDVSSASTWRPHLEAEGFRWLGSRDPVHFDYRGSSIGNLSIRAFQRLWNRNHPGDRIPEDGAYGPLTESRLARAPAEGFPIGACGSDAGGTTPTPGDAGVAGGDLGCERGMTCSDCNAIAFNCGFCAATGQCMAGDGSGPWAGSCSSGWQWITPASCPAPEEPPPPAEDPAPDAGTDPPPPMCSSVQGACTTSSECCGELSCRRGVTYGARCCVEAGNTCASGGDCCGYMDCVSGRCTCRSSGRACLADGDCCSGTCSSGTCR